ncbi:MAG: C-GCAxxG-C-C family protein [Bacteroidetes bacterium]|nr:C-GCAxxG-C-C family protein [Bacteroidota bacterium]
MTDKENKAKKLFDSGLNCAQSVLTVFAPELNINSDDALRISSAFGGGMGRLQEKCGAVTGAFMVLGIHCSNNISDEKLRKEKINSMVQEFDKKFEEIHGSTHCRQLMNCDLNTDEGKMYAEENNTRENVCSDCVLNSVRLLKEMLG